MNNETTTVRVPVAELMALVNLAKAVAAQMNTETIRTPIGDSGAQALTPPKSVTLDVSKINVWDLSQAATGVEHAHEYTRECERQLAEMAAAEAGLSSKSPCGLHVYTRPQMVATFSVHGSFGADGEVRTLAETAKNKMAYRHIGANRGYSGYDGRAYDIRSSIWCG